MFDEHLTRQHRLSYSVRGPEWAFAIPDGDTDVLEEVMRRCATFWNGAGSLLIPVRPDGRFRRRRVLELFLQTRPVEVCYLHPSLSENARASVQELVPGSVPMWDRFDSREVHALQLAERPSPGSAAVPVVEVPEFRSQLLRRIAVAAWGHIPDDDLPHWKERFQIAMCEGDAAHLAMLRGQVDGEGVSPLRLTARHMELVHAVGLDWPYIWVFRGASFRELVEFWNFRARVITRPNGAAVVAVAHQALKRPALLAPLAQWLRGSPGMKRTPDTYVVSPSKLDQRVREAFAAIPIREESGEDDGTQVSGALEPNEPPTFSFAAPRLAGPFIRGSAMTTLVAFAHGRCSAHLPAPRGFDVASVRHTRLTFHNLPLPLPTTPAAAKCVHRDAQARDGVMLLTNSGPEWSFDLNLPTSGQALEDWVGDAGFGLARSRDGHDADAILVRIGDLDALDVLADRQRFALLRVLAPASRKKLIQRLLAQTVDQGIALDEDLLAERLANVGVFLESEARTAGEIASALAIKKAEVYELMPPLIQTGFVHRGQWLQCPQCRFQQWLDLSEQDEWIRCRACTERYLMPVVDASGTREPEAYYKLDGLMARAMDQDVLPILLTLRAARPPRDQTQLFWAWPGVEIDMRDGQPAIEVDLVVSTGQNVWFYEAKQTAHNLSAAQIRRLIELATALGARPGLAAVQGEFVPELVEEVLNAGGMVVTEDRLFS